MISIKTRCRAFSKNSCLAFNLPVLSLLSLIDIWIDLIASLKSCLGGKALLLRVSTARHVFSQSINYMRFFFYHSVENLLRINKFFNCVLKIRGYPISICRRIAIRITIIISIVVRGITGYGLELKFPL